MLTREDCLALCELTEGEVAAIAEHEHVPEMIAMEMGQYLCHTPDGEARIERMIIDDIRDARSHGNIAHMAKLVGVLRHFIEIHPHT
ncbi:MAG: hypothetical protein O3B37_10095 [Proteobacteria bacterium]|nr:hypothetical protein [Pseudomonadota bacterium]